MRSRGAEGGAPFLKCFLSIGRWIENLLRHQGPAAGCRGGILCGFSRIEADGEEERGGRCRRAAEATGAERPHGKHGARIAAKIDRV